MAERVITDIERALLQRQLPTVTLWNRLEGRPRTHDFSRSLKAEVRDALWMLTRQWQMGEFQADDAASPVFAKIHTEMSRFDAFQAGNSTPIAFNYDLPLETQVEQRPIPFERNNQPISLDIRLLMGRQWLKLLASIGDFKSEFYSLYPIDTPDPTQKEDAEICSHKSTWQSVAAVARRAMDGYKLYKFLTTASTNHAHQGTSIPAAHHIAVETLEGNFIDWFKRPLIQPTESEANAWIQIILNISSPYLLLIRVVPVSLKRRNTTRDGWTGITSTSTRLAPHLNSKSLRPHPILFHPRRSHSSLRKCASKECQIRVGGPLKIRARVLATSTRAPKI
jgi:hypothetical protein